MDEGGVRFPVGPHMKFDSDILTPLILAVLLASFLFHHPIKFLMDKYRKDIYPSPKYSELSSDLGKIERALYVLAIVFQQAPFIAFWLGLKVAIRWKSWNGATKATDDEAQTARARYLIFLIGNGLSLLAAVVSVMIVWMLW